MPTDWLGNAIFSVIPTILLGLMFWFVMRAIIRGDRTARKVYNSIEAEERAKAGLPPREATRAEVDAAQVDAAQASTDADRD